MSNEEARKALREHENNVYPRRDWEVLALRKAMDSSDEDNDTSTSSELNNSTGIVGARLGAGSSEIVGDSQRSRSPHLDPLADVSHRLGAVRCADGVV